MDLINPYMTLHGRAAAKDAERAMRLEAGIACLDRALSLVPSNWAALWVRGKAFQALDDHLQAHGSFASAYALQPENPDVGRELVVECLELGKSGDAVTIADRLTKLAPQDAGLRANLALALLLDGQVQRARGVIADARRQDPKDPISRALEERIDQVADGSRRQPRTLREIEQ
ncbi:tetratricopeptide repeat protein [Sorangium sp. So ce426]|uniref:tetratricopeptide repeat protein n=1 Tax=Sorangium sp. So ce426 TaxID=3133312 RepID=UPI003F5C5E33